MRLKKLIKLSVLLLLTVSLSSCVSSGRFTLYPIQGTDFYIADNSDVCMSEKYFTEVLQGKLAEF